MKPTAAAGTERGAANDASEQGTGQHYAEKLYIRGRSATPHTVLRTAAYSFAFKNLNTMHKKGTMPGQTILSKVHKNPGEESPGRKSELRFEAGDRVHRHAAGAAILHINIKPELVRYLGSNGQNAIDICLVLK